LQERSRLLLAQPETRSLGADEGRAVGGSALGRRRAGPRRKLIAGQQADGLVAEDISNERIQIPHELPVARQPRRSLGQPRHVLEDGGGADPPPGGLKASGSWLGPRLGLPASRAWARSPPEQWSGRRPRRRPPRRRRRRGPRRAQRQPLPLAGASAPGLDGRARRRRGHQRGHVRGPGDRNGV
jgi:hypothetical protein